MAGAVILVLLLAWIPSGPVAAQADRTVALVDISHALEGRTITVSGRVRNSGTLPLRGLVIDAHGYGADGQLVSSGTDGIPWEVAPGATERFSLFMPIGPLLVREYVVQVAVAAAAARPLAAARKGIDIELYRQHIRSLITVRGSTRNGLLVVRADAAGLPVSRVSVRASLWALDPLLDHFRLVTLDFDAQTDRDATVFVSATHAILVSLQVVDVRLRANWSE